MHTQTNSSPYFSHSLTLSIWRYFLCRWLLFFGGNNILTVSNLRFGDKISSPSVSLCICLIVTHSHTHARALSALLALSCLFTICQEKKAIKQNKPPKNCTHSALRISAWSWFFSLLSTVFDLPQNKKEQKNEWQLYVLYWISLARHTRAESCKARQEKKKAHTEATTSQMRNQRKRNNNNNKSICVVTLD